MGFRDRWKKEKEPGVGPERPAAIPPSSSIQSSDPRRQDASTVASGSNTRMQPALRPARNVTTEAREFGLRRVWPHAGQQADHAIADVIVIHGLGAAKRNYILRDPETNREVHWLRDEDMLPQRIPNSRIFCYEWNAGFDDGAGNDSFRGHAQVLLEEILKLKDEVKGHRPVVFVAACFGGLLLAKALHMAPQPGSKYADVLNYTAGICFLGTPFQGSHSTLLDTCHLRTAVALEAGYEASSYLVDYLSSSNRDLDSMIHDFCEMIRVMPVPIFCFYETLRSDYKPAMQRFRDRHPGLQGEFKEKLREALDDDLTMVVVDKQSACLQSHRKLALDKQHGAMIRYSSPDDNSFQRVADIIKDMVEKAEDVLARKSHVEPGIIGQTTADNWPAPDFSIGHREVLAKHTRGTGLDFLAAAPYKNWAAGPKGTLLCPGHPGAGKTVQTAIIIDHLLTRYRHQKDTAVAYFYCDYGRQENQTRGKIVWSLLRQLLHSRSALSGTVRKLYEDSVETQSNPSDADAERSFVATAAFFSRIFVIIDSLDECDDKSVPELLKRLQQQCNICLLVTARFDGRIRDAFSGCPSLEITAKSNDIAMFLDDQLPKILPKSILDKSQWMNEIKQTVLGNTNGLFVLAQTAIMALSDKRSMNEISKTLQEINGPGRSYHNRGSSDILDSMYSVLLKRISSQAPGFVSIARQTLAIVCFSMEHLTDTQLQHALAIKEGTSRLDQRDFVELQDIISSCTGLVIIQGRNRIIRFFHNTAEEFMSTHLSSIASAQVIRSRQPADPGITISPEIEAKSSHRQLAVMCLTYMLYDEFSTGTLNSMDGPLQRAMAHPFYRYAIGWFRVHVKRAGMEDDTLYRHFMQEAVRHKESATQLLRILYDRGQYSRIEIEFGHG